MMPQQAENKMEDVASLTPNKFFVAWVSSLVEKGESQHEPDSVHTRKALDAVRVYFEERVSRSEEAGDYRLESASS